MPTEPNGASACRAGTSYAGRNAPQSALRASRTTHAPRATVACIDPLAEHTIRKVPAREADAPEGNLVIAERCGRNAPRRFPDEAYRWVETDYSVDSRRKGGGRGREKL